MYLRHLGSMTSVGLKESDNFCSILTKHACIFSMFKTDRNERLGKYICLMYLICCLSLARTVIYSILDGVFQSVAALNSIKVFLTIN